MNTRILTISREYGSGGHEIGKLVAEKLGITFYDKELLGIIAEKSGYSVSFIEEIGEEINKSFLFNLAATGVYYQGAYGSNFIPVQDNVFIAMNNVINEIASKEPCVIVGRCADYILHERKDCLHTFIHADFEEKVKRVIERYDLPEKNLKKEIEKKDKMRANHYRRYTGRIWGLAANYDITINSSKFGVEGTSELICNMYKQK